MKVTSNLKDKLRLAQQKGYKRVYSIVGAYKATTYCNVAEINELLNLPIGTTYGPPPRIGGRWAGWPNIRHMNPKEDIQYSELLKLKEGE